MCLYATQMINMPTPLCYKHQAKEYKINKLILTKAAVHAIYVKVYCKKI